MKMQGTYSYRNEAWFDICGTQDQSLALGDVWAALVDDEFIAVGKNKFDALATTKEPQ
jgi:hypothetical protein